MATDRKSPSSSRNETVPPNESSGSRPAAKREAWELEFEAEEAPEPVVAPRERVSQGSSSPEGRSWRDASSIVERLKPVPRLLWPVIHSVYGKPGTPTHADAMMFSNVAQIVHRTAEDKTLAPNAREGERLNLTQAVALVGADVAAAVCFVHAVCRKIYSVVPERVARPIVDDALLRTQLGFYVGSSSRSAGAGRGMIAGFAGRCGLAVQIASGDLDQAQRALVGLASGKDMTQVCMSVYGCDPLEVAALTLISGGCCREIAFGISSYSTRGRDVQEGTDQHLWLSLFSVIEGLRMGQGERVGEQYWRTLEYDAAKKDALNKLIVASQRRGHGWQWMTQPLLQADGEPKGRGDGGKGDGGKGEGGRGDGA